MGYTGLEGIFDFFRKSVVGDVQLMFSSNPYMFDNIMSRCPNLLALTVSEGLLPSNLLISLFLA
jgi:hypothetical protein